ncbi:putative F-box domain, galactose oxidase/kelch, beta-propeller, F-box associated interaction [Rosa chinensis]|uniref:Putative F-box domain, galactose oxidase/kelch, beta-propeller, F-box associated interaction n=1 Tax=Rosa chinensis TaxID=74649 RepID=A0A2P6RP18_ROSCH|nr:F-box/kelch-repeat protein At3g06240 [Rosa chinensis]PRQ48178.1 putative F-box domain, galactose oxidase/kelch, beta-propeller, F-box associated interaction [Rosa chinensis]
MAETEDLPEEIVVNILTWLPVKSLIRFTSVSKRLRFIILSDPKFAESQLKAARQQKTLSRRLLFSTDAPPLELESIHLDDTPSFGEPSSVRKLSLPFHQQPVRFVKLLGSCNGLVFVAFDEKLFYIWNPSFRFFKQLPDPPGFSLFFSITFSGVGCVSATDDYKVLVASVWKTEVWMFSSRARVWKSIQGAGYSPALYATGHGILLNEALHWVEDEFDHEILVFDLLQDEFRKMRLPNYFQQRLGFLPALLGVSFGGCLCVCRRPITAGDSADFWVMRQYDVRGGDSWTKLHNLKLSDPPQGPIKVMESSIIAQTWTSDGSCLVNIDHKKEEKLGVILGNSLKMIPYEESLLRISV